MLGVHGVREARRTGARHPTRDSGDDGLSMVMVVISLLVTALLTAILLGSTLHTGAGSSAGVSNAPGVAAADGLQAQQTLSTALSDATTAAAGQGGYGSLSLASLATSEPSINFVEGASSNATTVSVAIASDTGAVTMADRSSDGTCWLVWHSSNSTTFYGAQTKLVSCTAPLLSTVPTAGPVSASAIGWQEGTFPTP